MEWGFVVVRVGVSLQGLGGSVFVDQPPTPSNDYVILFKLFMIKNTNIFIQ